MRYTMLKCAWACPEVSMYITWRIALKAPKITLIADIASECGIAIKDPTTLFASPEQKSDKVIGGNRCCLLS